MDNNTPSIPCTTYQWVTHYVCMYKELRFKQKPFSYYCSFEYNRKPRSSFLLEYKYSKYSKELWLTLKQKRKKKKKNKTAVAHTRQSSSLVSIVFHPDPQTRQDLKEVSLLLLAASSSFRLLFLFCLEIWYDPQIWSVNSFVNNTQIIYLFWFCFCFYWL